MDGRYRAYLAAEPTLMGDHQALSGRCTEFRGNDDRDHGQGQGTRRSTQKTGAP